MFLTAGRFLVLTAFAATLAAESRALESNPFHFEADYFQVSQGFGGATDHFNDGVLTGWIVGVGTASEKGGAAIIESPGGVETTIIGTSFFFREATQVQSISGSALNIAMDGGEATATLKFLPNAIPQINQMYGLVAELIFRDGDVTYEEDFHAWIANIDAEFGAAVGMTEGMYLVFRRDGDGSDSDMATYEIPSLAFDSSDDVILQLVFDPGAYQFEASFSANGGAFQSDTLMWDIIDLGPPGTIAEFNTWKLEASSFVAVPEPSCTLQLGASLPALSALSWLRTRARRGSGQ